MGLSFIFVTIIIGIHHVIRMYQVATVMNISKKDTTTTTTTPIEELTFGVPLSSSSIPSLGNESKDNNLGPSTNNILPQFLLPYADTIMMSQVVELDHCTLWNVDWQNFSSWSNDILERVYFTNEKFISLRNDAPIKAKEVEKEWTMELLEMYMTHHGMCNIDAYQFKIKDTTFTATTTGILGGIAETTTTKMLRDAGVKLTRTYQTVPTPSQQVRLAIVIVAYRDSKQLQRLVDAVFLQHHFIVIHLDNDTNDTFRNEVITMIETQYPNNVVVLNFGSIVYETDSISRINLQIMDFLINTLRLQYDYHVTIDGAAFPLLSAIDLAKELYTSSGRVWLGELTHKGQPVHHPQSHLLWKKRLYSTTTGSNEKLGTKAGNIFPGIPIPEWLDKALYHKSTSGNQSILHFTIVQQLLSNRQVKELFAIAKYGCCCCLEERTWIGAMDILGVLDEAKERRSMYQLWGGYSTCRGSMQNAILEMDETICYRNENFHGNDGDLYFFGNRTWDSLIEARQQGTVFARKFHSDNVGSMQLLDKIVHEMHGTAPVQHIIKQ